MFHSRSLFFCALLLTSLSLGCSNSSSNVEEGGKYKDGKKHGPWVHKDQTGQKKSEGQYNMGLKEGIWTFYSKDKTIQTTYSKGKKEGDHQALFNSNKSLAESGQYKDDVKHGNWVEMRSDNQKISEGSYDHDKKHGAWKYYFSADRISAGEYVQDKKVGHWIEWQLDKKLEGDYNSQGMRDGNWIAHTSKGVKINEGAYAAGKRIGEWKSWSPDGKLILEQAFTNAGSMTSQIMYFPNGQKRSEVTYENGKKKSEKYWDEEGNEVKKPKKRRDMSDLLEQAKENGDL